MVNKLVKPTITINPKKVRYIKPLPKELVVIVDTREQQPYKLAKVPHIIKKLDFGDYSIKGFETMISIERKSQSDFYGTIVDRKESKNRECFIRELKQMQIAEFKGLLIDCEESELMTPELSYSQIKPNSVYGSLIAFEIRYGLHVYFGSRKDCEQKLLNWLGYFYRMKREV